MKAVRIAFVIVLFSSFIYLLEHDCDKTVILKHGPHFYAFINDQLFTHHKLARGTGIGKQLFAVKAQFFRRTNSLSEYWGPVRVIDFDSMELLLDETLDNYPNRNWQATMPEFIKVNRKGWIHSGSGFKWPVLYDSYTLLDLDLPDNYWVTLNQYHSISACYHLQADYSRIEFLKIDPVWVYRFKGADQEHEREPTVPVTFYIRRILFMVMCSAMIALIIVFLCSIPSRIHKWRSGSLPATVHSPSPQETITGSAVHPSRTRYIEAALIFLCVFNISVYYAYFHMDHIPHIVDEAGYLFQAKIFAAGRLSVPTPGYVSFLDIPGILMFKNPAKVYHPVVPGHPLLLVPGIWLGAPWIIPPALFAAGFVFIFLLAAELFDRVTAWITVILGLTSSWITILGSSFMAHTPAFCFCTMFMYFMVRFLKEKSWFLITGAGISLGIAIFVRPLTAFCISAAFLIPVFFQVVCKPRFWIKFLVFMVILGVFLGGLYAYTKVQGYAGGLTTDVAESKAFTRWNSLQTTAYHYYKNLIELQISLFGWPFICTLSYFIIGICTTWRNGLRVSVTLTFFIVSIMYSVKGHFGWCYEPRYWFETVPALLIISAAGIWYTGSLLNKHSPGKRWLKMLAFVLPVLFILMNFAPPDTFPNLYKACITGQYWRYYRETDEYRSVNSRLRDIILKENPQHAIIFVGGGSGIRQMTPIFPLINIDFEGNIIFGLDKKSRSLNQTLIDMYPDRQVFWFNGTELLPYTEYGPPDRGDTEPDESITEEMTGNKK